MRNQIDNFSVVGGEGLQSYEEGFGRTKPKNSIFSVAREYNGLWDLAGWQWMFIAEAIPTVVVGFFLLFCVTDRPQLAHWLSGKERSWLISTLETERRLVEAKRKVSLWQSFWDPKILWLTLNYFGVVTASVGMLLFLPQIVKQLGLTNMQVGWVTMIPYLCAVVAMLGWGWISDRLGERRWTLSFACLVSAVGLIIAAQGIGTVWALAGISPLWASTPPRGRSGRYRR